MIKSICEPVAIEPYEDWIDRIIGRIDGIGSLHYTDDPFPPDYPLSSCWIIALGQLVEIAEYPYLFGAYGYYYGGRGEYFRLPNPIRSRAWWLCGDSEYTASDEVWMNWQAGELSTTYAWVKYRKEI